MEHSSKDYTPPGPRITRSMLKDDDELKSALRTGETRNLRKEKKIQKEPLPPPKKAQPKKKKQKKVDVEVDEEGFPLYDPSLFPSMEVPEWLDVEEDWCSGPAYAINYGNRVPPFRAEWLRALPDAKQALDLRSAIFQHRDEEEYKKYVFCPLSYFFIMIQPFNCFLLIMLFLC